MDAATPLFSAQTDVGNALLRARAAQAQTATNQPPKNIEAIEKTAKEFEGMFLAEMLSHMFSGIEVDPEFGGGHGEEMFRSLMIQEYGKKIAEGPGLGIAASVKEVMIAAQERSSAP
jgi:Rod binding domain-containing protein